MCSKTYADGKTGKRPVSAQSNSTDPCSDKILNFGHLTSEGIEIRRGRGPALDFPEFGDVTMRDLAGTADGGCIFRLVVSRFNGLQRRCGCYPQQDPQTC
jgi:hypothetical protein